VKKRFNMKIALALKAKKDQEVEQLREQLKESIKQVDSEAQKVQETLKNEVKEKFNLRAESIVVDVDQFI